MVPAGKAAGRARSGMKVKVAHPPSSATANAPCWTGC